MSVDQKKVEFEYRSLIEFNRVQPNSVPVVYLLDTANKTSVLAGFKLQVPIIQ